MKPFEKSFTKNSEGKIYNVAIVGADLDKIQGTKYSDDSREKYIKSVLDEAKKELLVDSKLADHTEIKGVKYVCIEQKKWLKWFGEP